MSEGRVRTTCCTSCADSCISTFFDPGLEGSGAKFHVGASTWTMCLSHGLVYFSALKGFKLSYFIWFRKRRTTWREFLLLTKHCPLDYTRIKMSEGASLGGHEGSPETHECNHPHTVYCVGQSELKGEVSGIFSIRSLKMFGVNVPF